MSVPFYYNDGNQASKQLKDDMARVRAKHPKRFTGRKAIEEHMQEGKKKTVDVVVPPLAGGMTPKVRHELSVLGKLPYER